MRAKGIIAILAICGLLAFVAVSVLGGSKDKVASTKTALRAPENRAQPQVRDRHLVGSPLGTKDVPQQINYQGYLVDSSDSSAISDTLEMTFKIYDDPASGDFLWSEPQSGVPVINGLFNVLLGSVKSFPDTIFTGQELWLETTVGGQTLSPRKKLVSVPYAIKNDCWTSSGNDCYFDKSGNVGIGTTSPNQQLDIESSNPQIRIHDTASNEATIGAGYLVHDGSGIFHIKSTRTTFPGRIALDSGGSERMSIMYNGNVGIGTTNPGARLEVGSGPGYGIIIDNGAAGSLRWGSGAQGALSWDTGKAMIAGLSGNSLSLGANGAWDKLVINTNGNVGIGTTSPQGKLDINGSLAIAGDVGAAGQVLKSQGPGANPTWGEVDYVLNSDKVNNIHASTTPIANYLYPLDANAKFPNARLYTGSGNGLDADMVDGQHASAFVTQGQANSITSGMIINGTITDADISSSANIQPSKVYGTAWTSYNDGSGSGLDADKLDGQQGSYYFHWGTVDNQNGDGLYLTSNNQYGLVGKTSSTGSGAAGVLGVCNVNGATGALGHKTYGVYGEQASGTYAGKFDGAVRVDYTGGGNICAILANSNGNWGAVQGVNSSTGPGVYASNTVGNPALVTAGDARIQGNLTVTGNLTKGSGSFKIDHPLDPKNKYLYHSFVESPDMMNVYNGNVVLDAKGETVVELPDYFEALNKDFRYQLTAIGAPGPNLYIAEKITNSRFKIAGGQPGMEVSWQVTGIRKDPYAEANRIQVEVDKPVEERGRYLHPEAYGLGPEYGVGNGQDRRVER